MFFSSARQGNFTWAIRIFVFLVLTSAFGISPSFAQPQATESAVPSIPVLVSDFELFSLPAAATPATPSAAPIATPSATPIATTPTTAIATPPATQIAPSPATPISTPSASPIATPAATPIATPPGPQASTPSKQKSPLPLVSGDPNLPSVQARRLTDFFTATLLEILQKKGYNAMRASGQNPSSGAMIRGVFAETDAKNRIRRSLWGGNSTNSRFFLYVGIFNLGRPDQPLYEIALEQPANSQYGPIITLNNYIPLAKYELDKNPTDEDVRKICAQIAASLTALLAANWSAFAQ
ncbi:MAG TPA: hypothetical protein VNI81_11110 [Candidatus Limnocylindrales bacterium]|jgi:hypothetical protein|nr:hypothetical protein [Candidatus Limnocylindrales bacterium]